MDNNDILQPGKKVILTYDAPFLNSDAIFIEYEDVIKCPYFFILYNILNNKFFTKYFYVEDLQKYKSDKLLEWYINRKEKELIKNIPLQENVFRDFFKEDNEKANSWKTDFINAIFSLFDDIPEGFSYPFYDTLQLMKNNELVKNVYIYTEFEIPLIQQDIKSISPNFHYVHGNIKEILSKISRNSTFVFSDVTKILYLKELDLLNGSSIVIPEYFRYNYNEYGKRKIDIRSLRDEYIFKIHFINYTVDNDKFREIIEQ